MPRAVLGGGMLLGALALVLATPACAGKAEGPPAGAAGSGGQGPLSDAASGATTGGDVGAGGERADGGLDSAPTDASIEVGPSAVCSGSGSLGATTPMCPDVPMLAYDLVAATGEAHGALPACADAPRMTVTILEPATIFDGGQSNFETTYHAKRPGAAGDCGVRLDFTSVGVVPTLAPGDTVTFAQKVVPGAAGAAPRTTTVLSDGAGHVLLAIVAGATTADIGLDLLHGLTVTIDPSTLCSIRYTSVDTHQLHTVTFSDGQAMCSADSATERCCPLWDATYLLRVEDAYSADAQAPFVSFELARPGFWATLSVPN